MRTQATTWLRLTRHFRHARKSAWQIYWTDERKAEVTFVVASFFLSGLFFWLMLDSLY